MKQTFHNVVDLERQGDISIVTMNNPPKRNAYSPDMREGLLEVFKTLCSYDDPTRAIVLTGAGGNFSAGGDISTMTPTNVLQSRWNLSITGAMIRLIAAGPKPVISAIDGYAYGAGLGFACISDYSVAAKDTKYCAAFIKVGLLPDMGLWWGLTQRVGMGKAKEMIGLATEIDAEEALRLSIINKIVEPGKTLEGAIDIAKKFARQPPAAIAMMKMAFANGVGNTLEEALRAEGELQPMLRSSQDNQEAVSAFLEKRKPVFTGK